MTALSQPPLPQNYDDILQIIPRLPEPDLKAATASLAGMADLSPAARAERAWLARWQGRTDPRVNHPRLSLFAANHGAAVWMPYSEHSAIGQLAGMADPAAALGVAVAAVDADLRLYEMNLAQPSVDFALGAALSTTSCIQAMAYGMMAVEMGIDVLALASCGDGQILSAAVMITVLLDEPLVTVLDMMSLPASLADNLAPVVARVKNLSPCLVLEHCGGYEIAALVGALLACRMAHTPVVIADWAGLAALAVLHRLTPQAARHVALAGVLTRWAILPDCLRVLAPKEGWGEGAGLAAARSLAALKAVV
jgi:nicotinate-nucleotide--dimethylbenzimidazole phosphoribosyltransferase